METQAGSWTISGLINPAASRTSQCGSDQILGGYGVISSSSTFQRTYTSLPSHLSLLMNSWSPGDLFSKALSVIDSSNICGDTSFLDINADFFGQIVHKSSSATIRLATQISDSLTSRSLGIYGVHFIFKNSTTSTQLSSVASSIEYQNNPAAMCYTSQCFNGDWVNCDKACLECSDSGPDNCYSCVDGMYFDGNKCSQCYIHCLYCIGTSSTECIVWYSGYVHFWDNTCRNTACSAPFVLSTDQQSCHSPCESLGLYMSVLDYSCSSSCSSYLVPKTIGSALICDYSCGSSSTQYLYWTKVCHSTCTYTTRTLNGYLFCDLCPSGMFTYANQTCEVGFLFCDNPCDITGQYYYQDQQKWFTGCKYPYGVKDQVFCALDLTSSQLKQAKTITSILNIVDVTMSISAVLISLFASHDPTLLCFITFTKMLLYIRCIDVTYSPMLQEILWSQTLNKSPLPFLNKAGLKVEQQCHKYSIPDTFERYNLHSNFILNYWIPLMSLLAIVFGMCLMYLFVYCTKKWRGVNTIFRQALDAIKWNLIATFVLSNYDGIILFTSLEFRTAYMYSFIAVFSFIIALLSNLVIFVFLYRAFVAIYELRQHYTRAPDFQQKISETKHKYRAYKVYF